MTDGTGMAEAWAATARRMEAEAPRTPPGWVQMLAARPSSPPAWMSSPRRPAGEVDPIAMMTRLHDGMAAIERRQAERARRNHDQAARAMRLYQDVRRAHGGQAGRGPSLLVAAQLGLGDGRTVEIF